MNITAQILILSIILSILHPILAKAAAVLPPTYPSAAVLTEIQTGAGTAGDEFIELSNVSAAPLDITGWQVRYLNAVSTGSSALLAVIGEGVEQVVLQPDEQYVLRTAGISPPGEARSQVYTAKLSSADKAIGLFAPDVQSCLLKVQDAVAWGVSEMGEGEALANTEAGDKLIQRRLTADAHYVDTNTATHDVVLARSIKDTLHPELAIGSTMGVKAGPLLPAEDSLPPIGPGSALPSVAMDDCTLPDDPDDGDNGLEPPDEEPPSTIGGQDPGQDQQGPVMPAANIGLKSPQITELLPNPGKPRTDATDEFIELYNSNSTQFDLSGFALAAGAGATKKKYTFPQGSILPAKSFKAYFSADTHLALSNTKGQVSLLDPFGNPIGSTEVYGSAKDDQSWALASGSWRWTTQPTPGSANHIVTPATKASAKKSSAAAAGGSSQSLTGNVASTSSGSTNQTDDASKNLHTGVLALVAGIALLYGAYEYRSDLANKLHQLRVYRAARREARQGLKGR